MKEKINKSQQEKKQELTAALQEIGMTINEVKGWLNDVSREHELDDWTYVTVKTNHETRKNRHKNKLMKELFNDAAYGHKTSAAASRQYSDAINRLYNDIKNVEDVEEEQPETSCTETRSNVTFIPGTLAYQARLLVAGAEVQGDYKINYSYNTLDKKGVLQVEFLDPI